MKKRKKPILLLTLLVVLVAVAASINFVQNSQNVDPEKAAQQAAAQKQAEQPTLGASKEGPSKQSVAAGAKMAMAAKSGPPNPKMPPQAMEAMNHPSIEMPKNQAYKPTMNDSQIQGQWYSDQHAQAPASK